MDPSNRALDEMLDHLLVHARSGEDWKGLVKLLPAARKFPGGTGGSAPQDLDLPGSGGDLPAGTLTICCNCFCQSMFG